MEKTSIACSQLRFSVNYFPKNLGVLRDDFGKFRYICYMVIISVGTIIDYNR